MKSSDLSKHIVSIGPRYVFFNSLATETIPIYYHYLGYGMGLVQNAQNMLTGQDTINNSSNMSNIISYIKMIGDAADNAKAAELNFFSQIKDMIQGNEELKNRINNFIEPNTTNFNYLQFIKVLNDIMIENNKINQQLEERILNNMQLNQLAYEQAPENIKQLIQESYENFTTDDKGKLIYASLLKEIREKGVETDDKKYQTQITSLFTTNIQKAVNALATNDFLASTFRQQFVNNGVNNNDIEKKMIASIVQYIFNTKDINELSGLTGEAIVNNINNQIQSSGLTISDDYAEQVIDSFIKKTKNIRSIEDLALTSGKNVGKAFEALDLKSQQDILMRYGIDVSILSTKRTGKSKFAFYTQQLVPAIRKYFNQQQGEIYEDIKKDLQKALGTHGTAKKKILAEVRQKIMQVETQVQQKVPQNVFDIKLRASSLAELLLSLSSEYYTEWMKDPKTVRKFKLGQINLKTDLIINFLSDNLLTDMSSSLRDQIFDILDNSSERFLKRYKAQSEGEIDVKAAAEAFKLEQKTTEEQLRDLLSKAGKKKEEINKTLNELSNFISSSISVKDYNIFLSEEGFHAQSLGATSEKAINNIIQMYELGGITGIDTNLLMFAVNNCAAATIGYGLKDDLATFLLGGAALMTFDEGFSLLPNYIAQLSPDFNTTKMLLYNLGGKFIPASYVLSTVHSNLINAYGFTIDRIEGLKKDTNKVHINNNINNSAIPSFEDMPFAQDRWDNVRSQVEANVKISMTFMAGLLDIFEQLPRAFEVS